MQVMSLPRQACRLCAVFTLIWSCIPAIAEDAVDLAQKIDRQFDARWRSDGIVPADRADDAEFLRRVYLHIGGVIPTVSEARRFIRDESADKRTAAVTE